MHMEPGLHHLSACQVDELESDTDACNKIVESWDTLVAPLKKTPKDNKEEAEPAKPAKKRVKK